MQKLRIWKLGHIGNNPDNWLFPSEEAFKKLGNMLESIPNTDGPHDIMWGPALDVIELTLNPDGVVLNTTDFIVSASELKDALEIIRQKRKEKAGL